MKDWVTDDVSVDVRKKDKQIVIEGWIDDAYICLSYEEFDLMVQFVKDELERED